MKKLTILILLSLFLISSNAYACSCKADRTLEESVKDSDLIFTGKVKNLEESLKQHIPFTVDIYKLYKGKPDKITLYIPRGVMLHVALSLRKKKNI